MRDGDNIREIESLGVDLIGMIFYEKSPRYVSEKPAYLPQRAKSVGVFVDAEPQEIIARVRDYGLSAIQLHGHESPDYIRALKQALGEAGIATHASTQANGENNPSLPAIKILKAIGISDEHSLEGLDAYEELIDAFVFDTKTPKKGGSGKAFNHSLLKYYHGHTPFLLSGGLSLDNAEEIIKFRHPALFGLDLNSRFEIAPAIKDPSLVQKFLKLIRTRQD